MELPYRLHLSFDAGEIEGLAVDLYLRLSLDPERPIDTFRLARKLLGVGAIVRGTSLVGLPAKLFTVNMQTKIAINRALPFPYAQFFIGHELGHHICNELGYREDDIEHVCDHFGAAVMAPMPAVRAMLRAFGRDHEAIADEVGSTQTWAALRIAECVGIPRAIVTPKKTYLRGPEEFVFGSVQSVRGLVRGNRPGVSKVQLTDDPRRTVLDFEELEVG